MCKADPFLPLSQPLVGSTLQEASRGQDTPRCFAIPSLAVVSPDGSMRSDRSRTRYLVASCTKMDDSGG